MSSVKEGGSGRTVREKAKLEVGDEIIIKADV